MNTKVLDLEKMRIIICQECGSDSLKGIWNGDEKHIDLKCHSCGTVLTKDRSDEGIFKLRTNDN